MSLYSDIVEGYVDGNGLVSCRRVTPGTVRGSDNGPMFTSEFYILRKYILDQPYIAGMDYVAFRSRLAPCFKAPGVLQRAPDFDHQEGPDDYYGVLAACKVLNLVDWPREMLQHGYKHWGFFNTATPDRYRKVDGTINWSAWLWRQPQLIAAMVSAAGRSRIWHTPLYLWTALVIAASCMRAPRSDTDARRLSWLLIQTVVSDSIVCWLAAKIWYARLYRDYPGEYCGFSFEPRGMKGIAFRYYEVGHPFARYWVDQPPGCHPFPWKSLFYKTGILLALAAAWGF